MCVFNILSVFFNVALSCATVLCEDSDFEHKSFQKICGKKFWLPPGLTHGDEFFKIFMKMMNFSKIKNFLQSWFYDSHDRLSETFFDGADVVVVKWLVETVL